jgi:hypothetical protein
MTASREDDPALFIVGQKITALRGKVKIYEEKFLWLPRFF